MKRFLLDCGRSLLTGLSFCFGCALALAASFNWLDRPRGGSAYVEPTRVERPADIHLEQHARVPGAPQFTVRGTLRNGSEIVWEGGEFELLVKFNGAQIGRCRSSLSHALGAQQREGFEIACPDISGAIPAELVSYEVAVASAWYRPPAPSGR